MAGNEPRLSPTLKILSAEDGSRSSSYSEPTGASPPGESDGMTESQPSALGSPPRSSRRKWTYAAIAVVVVVVLIVAGYAIVLGRPRSSTNSMGTVLVPAGTLYSLPFEQYNAVIFANTAPVTVQSTLTNVGGAQLYVMSPAQYFTLVNTYNVTGYEWTSGAIQSNTYYHLSISIPAGSWDLVFSNSVPGNSTAIGFYTSLVETS